jgi:hypothetical protein
MGICLFIQVMFKNSTRILMLSNETGRKSFENLWIEEGEVRQDLPKGEKHEGES